MESSVALLNFDGSYKKQTFYQTYPYEWIELESMENTSLLCEKETLKDISNKIIGQKRSTIYFLDSGNYHYVSHVLQSNIKKPYSLILFDHHTDTLPSPSNDLISCGSWVLDSLNTLPMLKKVCMIGVSEDAPNHIPNSIHNKVKFLTEDSLQSNLAIIIKSILNYIPTDSVYISIDKDVLHPEDALTGWDHGTMRLKQMLKMLQVLFRNKDVIGLDICGEYPVTPTNENQREIRTIIGKNNHTNDILLRYVKRWMYRKSNFQQMLHA
ncbi:arginase family protein [Virgibacillus sp. SK37]|uniref:arginase family protein n=1 Tax=Virgibacillus sp. SK37 TaxID=403957 RepID=UPI00119F1949|nr:arginase family protein [Virgibacillus sp. SK37]